MMVRTQQVSFLIGAIVSILITGLSYLYINRKNQNDYIKTDSRFYDGIELLQNRIDDLKMIIRPEQKTTAPVALIAIDDASIEEIGRWPWSRTTIAQIANEVLSHGAKTLTFDAFFPEPERENILADKTFSEIIQKYPDQIILGTASRDQAVAQTHPYQDLCTAEAFLFLGGNHIVTLNPTFVVDDQTENFESYKWNALFEKLFIKLNEEVETEFLTNLNVLNTKNLTQYQQNSLQAKKNKTLYNYCYLWLTKNDPFLEKNIFEKVLPLYEETFSKKLTPELFNEITAQIKTIKPHPIPQYLRWYANTPVIQNVAHYTASFSTKMDVDGYVRRYPLFFRIGLKTGSSYIPSLALQTYLLTKKYRGEVAITEAAQEKELSSFKIFSVENDKEPVANIPVDAFSQMRLNYYGPEKSFYYVSAKELLTKNQNEIDVQIRKNDRFVTEKVNKKEFFKDKNIFIGATALGIYDIRNTPLQNAMPGPEIHLTALANLLEEHFIYEGWNTPFVITTATFLFGLIFSFVWAASEALVSIALFIISIIVLIFIDYQVFLKTNHLLLNGPIFSVFILTFITISLFKYFSEERNKLKVRKAFSKYVSPSIVEHLLSSDEKLELGGQKKKLTVLFSDLRGFTTFSEKLEPKELSDFLNIYLTRMTEEVFHANGTLDKFIGDAIMAFFGAPVKFDNHAEMACRCALRSIDRLSQLNTELKNSKFPQLEMGIGINTGEMSVGNMGSATIQNYTVMGDSVNLASRLEGLTRHYGCKIIIGTDTYESVKSTFTCREIDKVRVKGKKVALTIYELLYEGPIQTADSAWLGNFSTALELYYSAQFIKAKEHFEKCLNYKPADHISEYFILKCDSLISEPPKTWDGINNLLQK